MSRTLKSAFLVLGFVLAVSGIGFAQTAGGTDGGDPGTKVIRVGVLMPDVDIQAAEGEVSPGEALRSTYAALMNSESIELIALESKLTSLAIDEAVKNECDYILNLSLKQIVKKSGGGLFGRVLRDAGNQATYEASSKVPYGGNTGTRIARTTVRSTIINTGYTMSNMSVAIKKNDKFTLNYGLVTVEGRTASTKEYEAKAKSSNDDTLIMGLIETSANDIAKYIIENRPQ
jgi:hypothetical protein